MLVIRMQRTGRKGHAQFRVVVQDSRRTPTSGKIVASLGHFNPHTKETSLNKEKATFYLEHGAQPSERVVRLLVSEGVKLPKWVVAKPPKKTAEVRNPDKRRSTRPAEPEAPAEETPAEKAPAADDAVEAPVADSAAPDEAAEAAVAEETAPTEPEA